MPGFDYVITAHDAAGLTDDEISRGTSLFHTIEEEVWPEDPVTPLHDAIAEARALEPTAEAQRQDFGS